MSYFDRLLAALRSGNYPQAKGYLASCIDTDDVIGYCCLGLAAEIAGVPKQRTHNQYYYGKGKALYFIPDEAMQYFQTDNPEVSLTLEELNKLPVVSSCCQICNNVTLIRLNDKGVPFTVIADIIENHKDEIFKPLAFENEL